MNRCCRIVRLINNSHLLGHALSRSTNLICFDQCQIVLAQQQFTYLRVVNSEDKSIPHNFVRVIVSNLQASDSLRNVVLYCSYDSPLSCVRLLNLYLSKGKVFFRLAIFREFFLRTGIIRLALIVAYPPTQ